MTITKRQKIAGIGEDVEKKELLHTIGRRSINTTIIENSMNVPQKQ
jgi:hypothetical protein